MERSVDRYKDLYKALQETLETNKEDELEQFVANLKRVDEQEQEDYLKTLRSKFEKYTPSVDELEQN